MARILVVEDEAILARTIRKALEKQGHAVDIAGDARAAEDLFVEQCPELVLLDLRLPDGNGLEVLRHLKSLRSSTEVVMMTAFASVEDAVEAIRLGASDYLQKPLNIDDLRHTVSRILDQARRQHEIEYYRSKDARGADLDQIVGTCEPVRALKAKMQRLCSLGPQVAPPTILITGETGTGKGLVARTLHYGGSRADGPFIEVNCAAIPENLVESELFGHERGAFTDAVEAKIGLFQAAEKGSLFLDEIGCLGPALQVKILKAIEEKKVRAVGSRSEQTVDTQIFAATNGDLQEMVEQGSFREDLYYRLRVANLEIPPLRQRGADILVLADVFLAELSETYRLKRFLTDDARATISAYRWPGNVRELRNTLDRAVLFSESEAIDSAALGLPSARAASIPLEKDASGALSIEIPDEGIDFDVLERELISSALRKAQGSQTKAAKLLGLSRDTLRYRIEKFSIDPGSK